jgi:hypothetical protein
VCLCFLEFCHGIRASLGLIPYGNVQEDAIAIEADSLYMCVLFSIQTEERETNWSLYCCRRSLLLQTEERLLLRFLWNRWTLGSNTEVAVSFVQAEEPKSKITELMDCCVLNLNQREMISLNRHERARANVERRSDLLAPLFLSRVESRSAHGSGERRGKASDLGWWEKSEETLQNILNKTKRL